jgi:hypothetical protein
MSHVRFSVVVEKKRKGGLECEWDMNEYGHELLPYRD